MGSALSVLTTLRDERNEREVRPQMAITTVNIINRNSSSISRVVSGAMNMWRHTVKTCQVINT